MKPIVYSLQSLVYCLRSTAYSLRSAFTLVELLVVILVIAILAGITIPLSRYAMLRAKEARKEVMLAKMRSALDDYRATYGEYPITPDTNGVLTVRAETSKHYWDNVIPDLNTISNSIFTNVNLSTNTIEYIVADGAPYRVDYCLTFPLMLRQELEGRPPFMKFDKVSILYNIYMPTYSSADERSSTIWRRPRGGGSPLSITILSIVGHPIDRLKAIDPVSGKQWKYECYNGASYTLTTNGF